MSRKAQGLSLNAIIIAVIVLVVLIIILGITTGYFGRWVPKFSNISDTSCKGQGGEEKVSCNPTAEREIYSAQVSSGKTCCAKKTCEDLNGHCCGSGSFPVIDGGAWSCSGRGGSCCPN